MNVDKLRAQLEIDEGVVYEIYNDHLGYPTFGIGHLVLDSDPEYGQEVGTTVSEVRVHEVFEKDVQVVFGKTLKSRKFIRALLTLSTELAKFNNEFSVKNSI